VGSPVIKVVVVVVVVVIVVVVVVVGSRIATNTPPSFSKKEKKMTSPMPLPAGYSTTRDPATNGFILQQTMMRVKDATVSLDFYSRVLGMRLLKQFHFPEWKFSLYFMGYVDESQVPTDEGERHRWLFQQPATLELTHNHGTESDPEFKGYHNGNSDPRGFGHIGIDVPDVVAACERFESLGVKFAKKLTDGRMNTIAFITDPDGYWIEIFSHNSVKV